ncbi:MAG: endonuclease III domain-containing protein, partial [Aestuariivirgaceae bacterium]
MPPSELVEIHRRLLSAYRAAHGPLPCWKHLDPVSQLIHTMLGKRTRDPVARRAFKVLCHRFMFWTELADLPPAMLQKLIEPVTFADQKAIELGQALQGVTARHGALELDFLDSWPVEPARSWLERLSGVGPKTSAAVVNFSTLKKPALVADTHYLRFSERFGLIAKGASTTVAHRTLAALVPPDMTADDLE